MPKPIAIFKVGTHTDMKGVKRDYTREMLQQTVAKYSPATSEAPFVIGHPEHNSPAHGWVEFMKLDDAGMLWAYPKQVNTDFAESVNAGEYKHVSASFYLPDAPGNPVPGTLYLRHVGFLGAMKPAIQGLGAVSFAADDKDVVCFGNFGYELTADLFRNWRDYLIDSQGQEVADKILPNWMIESLREYANAKPQELQAAFAEFVPPVPAAPQEPAKTTREIELEQQLANLQAANAATARAAQEAAAVDFAENLVTAGQLPPVAKDKAIKLLTAAGDGAQVVSFAEGDEKPFADGLKDLLSSLPVIVNFAQQQGQKDKVDPSINNSENPLVAEAKNRAAAATR